MQRCKTCGIVLSADAPICGRCGQAVVAESPLLGILVGQAQQPMSNVPMVHGTPQVGSVPVVHGTASTLPERGVLESTPPSRPSYPPTPYYHWHRNRRPKVPTARWLTIIVALVVVIASIIAGLALLLPPSISLSSNVVRQGDTLHLHGSGFIPGSRVNLMLDAHLPLFVVDHSVPSYSTQRGTSPVRTIQVSLNGTFEVTIAVSPSWPLGRHTIRAMESVSLRSTEVNFTIEALPGMLTVTPLGLDFSMVQQRSTATQILTISNTGQQPLDWVVNVGNSTWLSLDSSTGTLQPGTFQTIHVTADASSLSVGKHSGTLMVSVEGESMQVGVSLVVATAPVPTPTPKPNIVPTSPLAPTSPPTPTRKPTKPPPAPTPTPKPSPTPISQQSTTPTSV